MTTSCYLPVFYCLSTVITDRCSFLKFLFKELSGLFYCLIVNVLRCCLPYVVQLLYHSTDPRVCQQLFEVFLFFHAVPFSIAVHSRDSFDIISLIHRNVNTLFYFFSKRKKHRCFYFKTHLHSHDLKQYFPHI